MERRLAAIMATDVVGYSRLIRVDEEGTLAALQALRADLIDPKIAEHHGRIVKLMGDGMLAEFPSVVDAVHAAVETQQALAERNSSLPMDKRIEFRVGINLGDVVIDGNDIQGDGVNVAARLEAIAEPGGICVSGMFYEGVRDKIDFPFEDLGEQEVKNIARPIRVWQWSPTASVAMAVTADNAQMLLPVKPSIAVLSFDNMSSDPDHEFFAGGIAEDIITALSKISRMRVIARNSTFAYKGQALDLRRVATELGVRYVLEGSIRSGGSRLRITAQLIDATDGSHIWAERFDRTIDDIFDIQDQITKEIVTALRVNLTDGEEAAVLARGTNDIEAWQLCVRATELFQRFNSTDYLEARVLAEKAVTIDPDYAYAWATLGFTHWWDGRLGYTGDTETKFARAAEYAERAMALDNSVSWVIGLVTMLSAAQGRHNEGVAIARRGFENNPGNADARAFLAFGLVHAGDYEEGIEHFRAAMSLNPFYPLWYRNGLARALIVRGEYDEALVLSDGILRLEPTFVQGWLQKAYVFGQTGRTDDANRAIKEVLRLAPGIRLEHVPGLWLLDDAAFMERFLDGLSQAGLPA